MKDERQDLAAQLQRDAECVRQGERFDARLHQDTVRRIRQIPSAEETQRSSNWLPMQLATGAAAAALACWLVVISLPSKTPVPQTPAGRGQEIAVLADPKPTSALAYRRAFADGEDALLAMLDRDARVTLPRSANIFRAAP